MQVHHTFKKLLEIKQVNMDVLIELRAGVHVALRCLRNRWVCNQMNVVYDEGCLQKGDFCKAVRYTKFLAESTRETHKKVKKKAMVQCDVMNFSMIFLMRRHDN